MALVHPPHAQPYLHNHAPPGLPPPSMIWVPQQVVVDMNALRKQVEAEVEVKYKQRIDTLNRSIDVLERDNLRLQRLVARIRKERRVRHDGGRDENDENLDVLIANKALELYKLGIM